MSAIDELEKAAFTCDGPNEIVAVPLSTAIAIVERLERENAKLDKSRTDYYGEAAEGWSKFRQAEQQVATLTAENERLKQLVEQGTPSRQDYWLAVKNRDGMMTKVVALTAVLEAATATLKLAQKYGNFDPLSDMTIIRAIDCALAALGEPCEGEQEAVNEQI